jgi:hypothetical protein
MSQALLLKSRDFGTSRIGQGISPYTPLQEVVCELRCWNLGALSVPGLVSRVLPVHTAVRNCTRDEGGRFEVGNQVLTLSHRKLLSSKAMVVNVAETPGRDFGRQG